MSQVPPNQDKEAGAMAFNIGDKVRCIDPNYGLMEGAAYEVMRTYLARETQQPRRYVTVRDDRGELYYGQRSDRFEPIQQEEGETERATQGTPPRTPENELEALVAEATRPNATNPTDADPLAEFKGRVWEKAQAAKAEHGWCQVVDDILAELNVHDPNPRVKYRVMIPVEVEGPPGAKAGGDLFQPGALMDIKGALSDAAGRRVSVREVHQRRSWVIEEEGSA